MESYIWSRRVTSTTPSEELMRVRKTADMLCTGHASLRDRFARYALGLDVLILATSTWLVALSFVDPKIGARLTPWSMQSQIWVGLLGVITFFLTLVQIKTDLKSRADSHRRTFEMYAEVKREAGYLIAAGSFTDEDYRRVISRYDMASAAGVAIPERDFLAQKRRHKNKVELSKYLDAHPFATLALVRIQFWLRDNMRKAD
jgi:hypothetical protein